MRRVMIINTGGTIAMSNDMTSGFVMPNSENPINKDVNLLRQFADLEVIDFSNIPSPHMTPDKMLQLSHYIQQQVDGVDGIVVTHGTDTLEETAYFVHLTINTSVPIVFTGAMRSSNEIGADGLANLRSAIIVAASPESRDKGVLVVMNDEVHSATYVTKTHTTNLATFQTPTFGPLGIITKNEVFYIQRLIQRDYYPLEEVSANVYLIQAFAGMDGRLLNFIATQDFIDGIVLEGLGAGNMPPATVEPIYTLLERNIPVVMVSRSFNGVPADVYDYTGGGKQLAERGVIYARVSSGIKARIKLQVLLSSRENFNIRDEFM